MLQLQPEAMYLFGNVTHDSFIEAIVGNTERGGESEFLFPTIVSPVKTYIFRTQDEQQE